MACLSVLSCRGGGHATTVAAQEPRSRGPVPAIARMPCRFIARFVVHSAIERVKKCINRIPPNVEGSINPLDLKPQFEHNIGLQASISIQ